VENDPVCVLILVFSGVAPTRVTWFSLGLVGTINLALFAPWVSRFTAK
jgi:hypothetical protein